MRLGSLSRIALLALIWGSGFLWIKLSLRGLTPIQLTFGRLALGAVVLLVILWRLHQALPTDRTIWIHLIGAALLGNAIPYLLFGIAERTVTSSLAGAINATTPLWTMVFAFATRTERQLGAARLIGLGLGFAGSLVMLAPWQETGDDVSGAVLCLIASASYGASYVYMGRFLTGRNLPPLVLSAGQLVAASGWLIVATPFGGLDAPEWRADAVISLLVLGTIGTGAAYLLNYRIIQDDGPILASTVTYLLPVVAVVLGLVVLSEPITFQVVFGIVVVLAGVALTRRAPQPRPALPTPKGEPGT